MKSCIMWFQNQFVFSDIPTPFSNIVHPPNQNSSQNSPIFMATDGEHWIARWCLPKFDKTRPRRNKKARRKNPSTKEAGDWYYYVMFTPQKETLRTYELDLFFEKDATLLVLSTSASNWMHLFLVGRQLEPKGPGRILSLEILVV